eukprot:2285915-Rhodomonas_salina.2
MQDLRRGHLTATQPTSDPHSAHIPRMRRYLNRRVFPGEVGDVGEEGELGREDGEARLVGHELLETDHLAHGARERLLEGVTAQVQLLKVREPPELVGDRLDLVRVQVEHDEGRESRDVRRDAAQPVVVEEERSEARKRGHGFRDVLDLVRRQHQRLQRGAEPDAVRQHRDGVLVQDQLLELCEPPEVVRERPQVVAAQRQLVQALELRDVWRDLVQRVRRHLQVAGVLGRDQLLEVALDLADVAHCNLLRRRREVAVADRQLHQRPDLDDGLRQPPQQHIVVQVQGGERDELAEVGWDLSESGSGSGVKCVSCWSPHSEHVSRQRAGDLLPRSESRVMPVVAAHALSGPDVSRFRSRRSVDIALRQDGTLRSQRAGMVGRRAIVAQVQPVLDQGSRERAKMLHHTWDALAHNLPARNFQGAAVDGQDSELGDVSE